MKVTQKVAAAQEAKIDAYGLHYRQLNEAINEAIAAGAVKIKLLNVNGHRYITDGVRGETEIEIQGTAGDDLGAFMNGPTIIVHGNAQDGIGNTMNAGKIIVHGDARDIVGHSMRGGRIYVNGDVGYRVGIHMKEYKESVPVIIAAGKACDFLGEYMAGGRIVVLGIKKNECNAEADIVGDWVATGIHGGIVYVRGRVEEHKLGIGAKTLEFTSEDREYLRSLLKEFCETFGYGIEKILREDFSKIVPLTHRPFGKMYTD